MVQILEIAFLVVSVVLGLWWFSRTNIYRAHRRSGADPGQFGVGTAHSIGMLGGQTGGHERRPPHGPEQDE
jgi:hypothetical protein